MSKDNESNVVKMDFNSEGLDDLIREYDFPISEHGLDKEIYEIKEILNDVSIRKKLKDGISTKEEGESYRNVLGLIDNLVEDLWENSKILWRPREIETKDSLEYRNNLLVETHLAYFSFSKFYDELYNYMKFGMKRAK